jgi:hypothetical protein
MLDIASACDSRGMGESTETDRVLSRVVRESRLQKNKFESPRTVSYMERFKNIKYMKFE